MTHIHTCICNNTTLPLHICMPYDFWKMLTLVFRKNYKLSLLLFAFVSLLLIQLQIATTKKLTCEETK